MKKKLLKKELTLWISAAIVLYALIMLMIRWFGDAVLAGYHGWFFFPTAALCYMWFLTQRHGPLWALPALLFCILIEIILTAGRDGLNLSSLWLWMQGPTLWGPVVG